MPEATPRRAGGGAARVVACRFHRLRAEGNGGVSLGPPMANSMRAEFAHDDGAGRAGC